jgi:hypothetical protein
MSSYLRDRNHPNAVVTFMGHEGNTYQLKGAAKEQALAHSHWMYEDEYQKAFSEVRLLYC